MSRSSRLAEADRPVRIERDSDGVVRSYDLETDALVCEFVPRGAHVPTWVERLQIALLIASALGVLYVLGHVVVALNR